MGMHGRGGVGCRNFLNPSSGARRFECPALSPPSTVRPGARANPWDLGGDPHSFRKLSAPSLWLCRSAAQETGDKIRRKHRRYISLHKGSRSCNSGVASGRRALRRVEPENRPPEPGRSTRPAGTAPDLAHQVPTRVINRCVRVCLTTELSHSHEP